MPLGRWTLTLQLRPVAEKEPRLILDGTKAALGAQGERRHSGFAYKKRSHRHDDHSTAGRWAWASASNQRELTRP